MEKEPLFNTPTESENLESELKRRGYHIEKMPSAETGPIQCDACMKEGHFDFYDEAWFIGDSVFCQGHKENAMKRLEQMDEDSRREKAEREGLTVDERAMQRLIIEAYKKDGRTYWKEEQKIREHEPKMPLGEIIKKLYEEIEKEQGKKE